MRNLVTFLTVGLVGFAVTVGAQESQGRYYKWVDADGVVHYEHSIPPEYTDLDKEVVNEHGVTVRELEGRKTEAELAAEKRAADEAAKEEILARADKALLATYITVDEILMHRDRRVELFQAQSRVTELYLRNLERQLEKLERQASRFQPYSSDPDAEMIDPGLVTDISETKDTIERHQGNLHKFQADEQLIVARFDGDISRFKALKGIE